MSFLSPDKPKMIDEGAEKAKMDKQREDQLKRSRFEENTKVAGKTLGDANPQASDRKDKAKAQSATEFRSTLGR